MNPLLFVLCASSCLALTGQELIGKYIELSMDLTANLREQPEFSEKEVHDLAKDCVVNEESQKHLMKTYEAYLSNKSLEYQRYFTEKVIIPRHMAVVTEKLEKLPGYYLTKAQIEQVRAVLLEKKLKGAPVEETIAALKEELSKGINEEKASRAVEMLLKDLKILYKMHGNMVQQVDPAMAYLLHDEL